MAVRRKHVVVILLLLACAGLLTFIVSGHPDSATQAQPSPGRSGDSVALADGVRQGPTVSTKGASVARSTGSSLSTGPTAPSTSVSTDPAAPGSARAPGSPPSVAPSLSIAPPAIPNGGPSTSGSTTGSAPSSTPTKAIAATSSSPAAFQAHAVNAGVPAKFGFLSINSTMQATAANCATSGAACSGVASGTTSTCTYPAYSGSMTNVIAVGYSMWMYAPNVCRYAMGVIYSGRNG
jgi:hypothetical protein